MQTKGLAMSTPFAPNLTNLFMTQFEEQDIYDNSVNSFQKDLIHLFALTKLEYNLFCIDKFIAFHS